MVKASHMPPEGLGFETGVCNVFGFDKTLRSAVWCLRGSLQAAVGAVLSVTPNALPSDRWISN